MIPITRKEFKELLERWQALEAQLTARLDLEAENRALQAAVHAKEQELTQRESDIGRLKNDLLQQKRAWERELAAARLLLEEKVALLERKHAEQLAMAQEFHERQLLLERERFVERAKRGRDRLRSQLADFERREGFWARLLRMFTWS
jgi:hypothetical protein